MANLTQNQLNKAIELINKVELSRDEKLSNYQKQELIAPELAVSTVAKQPSDSRLRQVTIGNRTVQAALARGVDADIRTGALYVVKAKETKTYPIDGRNVTVPEGVLNFRIYAA